MRRRSRRAERRRRRRRSHSQRARSTRSRTRSATPQRPERPQLRSALCAPDRRDVDSLVVVLQDLLRRLAAECHSLSAPLRHSNTMSVSLAGEHETRRKAVLPPEDAERVDRAVGIFDAYRERPLDGRAEKVELTGAIDVRGLDVLGLFGTRRDGEERAAKAEVIPRPILADVARSRRPDDLR